MKYTFFVLASIFCLLNFTSCRKVVGEGPLVTETRDVTNFKGVSVTIGGVVNYKIDPVYKVEVRAQQNILDVLQTIKVGDDLVIKIKDGVRVKEHEDITVTINAPYAQRVTLSGSGQVNLVNQVAAADMDVRISGSGDINVPDVALTGTLTSKISGSGNIYFGTGSANSENLDISGSGKMDFGGVAVQNTSATISGSGDMWVKVNQNLDAHISGSGSVFYRGNPVISTHVSGSGKVLPF